MPSEMFKQGQRDAEADALNDHYYQYYYDYRLGYDDVLRKRRRSRQLLFLSRLGQRAVKLLPVILVLAGAAYATYRYVSPADPSAAGVPTPTRTPRPTLVPPTPRPPATPTPEPVLRADGFAVITGTSGAPLRGRQAPGTNNPVVVRFPEGTTVKILEGPQIADDLEWWRIEMEGKAGWSAGSFLKPVPSP